ncbi:hypothetical protein BH20VER3_BH20VER3_19700 [soil metagenome]
MSSKLFVAKVVLITICLFGAALPLRAATPAQQKIFGQVWQTVRDHFFDPKLNGVNWEAARERASKEVQATDSVADFSAAVNRMLSELKTSHTQYYTPAEPDYDQIAGIFRPFRASLSRRVQTST